jgi:threonine/homoserine/homoserine lactone efflux protein
MTNVAAEKLPFGEYVGFVSAAMLLLFVPGPTNTLLAARGARLGFRRALSGILAEMSGYTLAILMLRLVLEPIVEQMPATQVVVKVGCATYLIFVSYELWIGAKTGDTKSISWWRIFWATMTNPKAFLFAFVILPMPRSDILRTNLVNGLILLALIMLAGMVWTMIGALAVARAPSNASWVIGRTASLVLVGFSVYIFIISADAIIMSHRMTHVH